MHFRCENINISRSNIFLIQCCLSAFSFLLRTQINQSIACHLTVRFIKDNVFLCNSEISEEISDLLDSSVEW